MCPSEGGECKPWIWSRALKAERPHELIYTFNIKPLEGKETTVAWSLHPIGRNGTRLTLMHSGLGVLECDTPCSLIMASDVGLDEHTVGLCGALN